MIWTHVTSNELTYTGVEEISQSSLSIIDDDLTLAKEDMERAKCVSVRHG